MSKRRVLPFVILLVSQTLLSSVVAQTTRHVAPDGLGQDGSNNCSAAAQPCATIAHAIGQSQAGDTIQLQTGIYTESFSFDRNLTLQGTGLNSTTLQAHSAPNAATTRVLTIPLAASEVEVRDLTIRHGRIQNGNGGGILNAGSLTMERVRVMLNQATGVYDGSGPPSQGLGGGIYSPVGSSIAFSDVEIVLNQAGVIGGGLFLTGGGQIEGGLFQGNQGSLVGGGLAFVPVLSSANPELLLTDVDFTTNEGNSGAGMVHAGGTVIMQSIAFVNNTAGMFTNGLGGGFLLTEDGSVTGTDVSFNGNSAEDGGGIGLIVDDVPVSASFTNLTLMDNVAAAYGGGIRLWASPPAGALEVIIDGLNASGNVAGQTGGAIHNLRAELEIKGACLMTDNEAAGDGGALFNGLITATTGSSITRISDGCTIGGNVSGGRGGAIFNDSGSLTLNNVHLIGNQAQSHGGGLYNQDQAVLEGGSVSGNQSGAGAHGGGIYNDSELLMSGLQVSNNETGSNGHGGGLFNASGGDVSIIDSVFDDNIASNDGNGGGLLNAQGGTMTLTESTFRRNSGFRGGAVRNSGTMQIVDSLFEDNQARNTAGGAIVNWSGSPVLSISSSTLRNNSANTRGGGLYNEGSAELLRVAFVGNDADYGGGINHAGGPLNLVAGAIRDNHARINGGGVRTQGTGFVAMESMIAYNSADGSGGGLHSDDVNTLVNTVWWGSITGPQEPVLNPDGQGNSISGDGFSYLVFVNGLNLSVDDSNLLTGEFARAEARMTTTFGFAGHASVDAHFVRTGANPGTAMAPFFDGSQTIAVHQWRGFSPGLDEVVAETWYAGQPSGLFSAIGSVDWTGEPLSDEIYFDRFQQ